ncbi:AzlD domain-containing protein [Hahella ganghwensis]|uniref:AzlD domain-containing protein n=1 Tax=Hahella ganghwensis TaxID=286420 RepID=UPI000360948D|nr:AzlD domain-containing protein [Hahella ganghwensis]
MTTSWWTIFLMAAITFYCRYLFFTTAISFSLKGPIKRMLQYTAPSVLTAMWVPIIFIHDGNLTSGLDDPFLLAGIVTVVMSVVTRHTLLVVGVGIGSFVLARMLLGQG